MNSEINFNPCFLRAATPRPLRGGAGGGVCLPVVVGAAALVVVIVAAFVVIAVVHELAVDDLLGHAELVEDQHLLEADVLLQHAAGDVVLGGTLGLEADVEALDKVLNISRACKNSKKCLQYTLHPEVAVSSLRKNYSIYEKE